jgi:hypothetical protein
VQTNRTVNGSLTFLAESAESAKLVLCGTPRANDTVSKS